MVKHSQTICRQQRTNCLSVFDHFVGLVLKRLKLRNEIKTLEQRLSLSKVKKTKSKQSKRSFSPEVRVDLGFFFQTESSMIIEF